MALDELIAKIDQLRERMEAHKADLSKSEAMTRYALIDPLLAALGWDISDPSQVRPEYKIGAGRADYALLKTDGKPFVFVEAKSLDKALSEGVGQSIQYCVETGTLYFVVTNGREWALYDVFQPVPIEEKRVGGFDISGPSSEAAFRALGLLWQPLLRDEVKPSSTRERVNPTPSPSPQAGRGDEPVILSEADTTVRNWPDSGVPLEKLKAKKGTTSPKRLFLPGGQQISLHFWKDLLVEIARYLVNTGKLSSRDCPVQLPKATKNYIVHTEAVHASGTPFEVPYDLGHGLQLETHAGAYDVRKMALFLIDHCGEEPSDYGVESV